MPPVYHIPLWFKEEIIAYATVSFCDYEFLRQYCWRANIGSSVGTRIYAVTNIKGKRVYMHKLIKSCPDGSVVDHIDNNPLNNTRENLEVVIFLENMKRVKAFQDGQFKSSASRNLECAGSLDLTKAPTTCYAQVGNEVHTFGFNGPAPQVFEYFGAKGVKKAKKDRAHLGGRLNIHCKIVEKRGNAVLTVFPYTGEQTKQVADYMSDHPHPL